VWFGFYDNAFRLMRDAYAELDRPAGSPLATFDDAFKGCDQLVLYDRQAAGWHPYRFDIPRNSLRPGDPGELPTFWEMAATACRWALGGWRDLRDRREDLPPAGPEDDRLIPDWFEDLAADLAAELIEVPLDVAERLLGLAERLARFRARHTDHLVARQAAQPALLVRLLKAFREWLWTAVAAERYERDPELRFFFTAVDAGVSTVAGIVEDGVLERGFDAVDDEDWADWLARHGAREVTIGRTPAERSPVLRSVYDVAFAYLGGDIGRASCAAGTATSDLLRLLFSYRGSIMYKMQAGMGDVVFTPLYEVLARRGVRFEFFSAVQRLGLAAGARRVDTIDVASQAELISDAYDPLVDVKGLACWPSRPLWEQLVDGADLEASGVDFERHLNPLGGPARTLRRGVDFDKVVLGIPVGALSQICGELIERDPRFRRAVETAATVQTQAFQLWSHKPAAELGWAHDENSVAGCYVEPLDTYCDMSHLVSRESWQGPKGARTIGYVCGVIDDRPGETPDQTVTRARRDAIEFVERDLPTLWPRAQRGGRFDWGVLIDPRGRSGPARFDAQYSRANVAPWERYVLTPAGSVEHRLPSGDSGFENLVLAGDWTRNGIDGGCVEAAVVSGMDAAKALTGSRQPIPGRGTRWLRSGSQDLPGYVEFGGRATAPAPFACEDGRLKGLLLRGDAGRIAALVERMFNAPAGASTEYRALGSRVLLLIGRFGRVTSLTPPFDRWGAVRETQASFFVPVVAGRDTGGLFVAERLLLAVPYIFVDNPMSYLGGREAYGYAKTMARFTPVDGLGESTVVEAFGGDFGRNEGAAWREFLSVEPTGGPRMRRAEPETSGLLGLLRHLVGDLTALDESRELIVAGLRLPAGLLSDLEERSVSQVFLKQFRDAADGTRACYQAVVEAPVRVDRVITRPAERDHRVTFKRLDSHPIDQELGLTDQRAEVSFEAEMDFVVEEGHEVGRVAAPSGVTPTTAFVGGDGYTSVIESAARWVWREITALERASIGRFRRP
jgi:uncharacterized protein with NAD-binding domain and iron-sulfur cluster